MESDLFQREFLSSLNHLGGLENLFENLPNMNFFMKDDTGRFVMVNQATARLCGRRDIHEVVGLTDYDLFPKYVADSFRHDDLEIMRTCQRMVHRIEPVMSEGAMMRWCATNKIPVYGRSGKVVGVAGITQEIDREMFTAPEHVEFAPIIAFIHKHYAQPITIEQLAHMAALSISQFERRFKQAFHETPMKFILNVRIHEACKALTQTRQSVAWISQSMGFCDPSYFSKHFVKRLGMTPRQYRQRHFQGKTHTSESARAGKIWL